MIEIHVISYNGRSPAAELRAEFGAEGGTLGRGADNRLVLPDPARHVSRVQARIRADGGRYLIANVSEANPLFLNEEVIESGTERPLAPGDELRIGLYILAVREAPAAAKGLVAPQAALATAPMPIRPADPLVALSADPQNPFADLLGTPVPAPPASIGASPAMEAPSPRPLPLPSAPQRAIETPPPMPPLPPQAPRAAEPPRPAASPASAADPFADLLGPGAAPASALPASDPLAGLAAAVGVTPAPRGIPEDFDPFAMPSRAQRNPDDPLRELARAAIDLGAVDNNAKRSSLLEFDLAPKANPKDPLQGGTPSLVDPQQVVDPLRLFGGNDDRLVKNRDAEPLSSGFPMRDDLPEIGAHFAPPRGIPEAPAPPSAPSLRAAPPSSRVGPAPLIPPDAAFDATPPLPPETPPSVEPPRIQPLDPLQPAPTQMPGLRAAAGVAAAQALDPLLQAFLEGARMTGVSAPTRLTPALMQAIGTLVYQATAGAMELIAARQITKREIRAEVTMIVAQGNNPLKFLPTPEAAMMQMLGPKMPGFMATGEAMQDAFDDLRAHEVGVIAGVRAALAEVLHRFDPALLQERLGKGGLLDTLLPVARRAKLWDLFEQRFQELYREANDDFQSLFGEAFTKAYEEQIEQDRARRKPK